MSADEKRGTEGRGLTTETDPDEVGPVGIFPSWKWVYRTVLVYGVLMIVFLTIMTRLLDPGTP